MPLHCTVHGASVYPARSTGTGRPGSHQFSAWSVATIRGVSWVRNTANGNVVGCRSNLTNVVGFGVNNGGQVCASATTMLPARIMASAPVSIRERPQPPGLSHGDQGVVAPRATPTTCRFSAHQAE
jgi:hypothetical protein